MLRMMWEFFKTGLFAVGGGMATFPFLQEMTRKYDRFSEKELLDMIAVSESTPGAIGINCATYAGYKAYGFWGGVLATLSLIAPAIVIILVIARAMQKFQDSLVVKDLFSTLRPATGGLIFGAMFSVMVITLFNVEKYRTTGAFLSLFNRLEIGIFLIALYLQRKFSKVHPIYFIIAGAILGIVFKL